MSCTVCSYITGHDPEYRHYHEDRQREQEDQCARIDGLETRLDQLEKLVLDYAHLKKLYGESREYVRTLERERDELVEANTRSVAEQDRLDALVERMRPVYEAAKRMRTSVPLTTANEMCARGFHTATCDLVEAVDRAVADEPEQSPYREAP